MSSPICKFTYIRLVKAWCSCTLCQTGKQVDEQHLVLECPALQGFKNRHNALCGDSPAAMVQFIWQCDTRAVAYFIKECKDAHGNPARQS